MAKKAQMGDFIGFCFNNIHSSELGLVRVSDGNRYEKNLFPAISDKTVQVPGRDGFYYFGSSYNSREITVKVAFDNLEENEFRRMTKIFKDKKPHFLWFDELPYKEYLVKIKNPPNFKYLCFDEWVEEDNDDSGVIKRKARIYKGEGTIVFVCYSPYARARAKSLNEEVDHVIISNEEKWPTWFNNYYLNGENQSISIEGKDYPSDSDWIEGEAIKDGEGIRKLYNNSYLDFAPSNDSSKKTLEQFYNFKEWEESSKLPQTKNEINESKNSLNIKNCGDIEMNTKILLDIPTPQSEDCIVSLKLEDEIIKQITISNSKLQESLDDLGAQGKDDAGQVYHYFFLDSQMKLLRAYDSSKNKKEVDYTAPWNYEQETNKVFNNCITYGDFFKIPPDNKGYTIEVENGTLVDVEYTYLYY